MSLLGPPARGAICLLVVSSSIVVLSTAGGLGSDATSRSAAAYLSVDDDYGEEDESGDSSFSFPDPETSSASTGLVFGFYDDKCPDAEEMVSSMVRKLYHADPNVAAALVRLFFHDCFIHGCDASVLLDRVGGQRSERDAGPNQSLRGLGAVEAIKRGVEKACPGTVSCADILALAARDSLVLVGGPTYPVLTGRRDSAQSFYYDADGGGIPPPNATYAMTLDAFARRGQFTELTQKAVLLCAQEPTASGRCGAGSSRTGSTTSPGPARRTTPSTRTWSARCARRAAAATARRRWRWGTTGRAGRWASARTTTPSCWRAGASCAPTSSSRRGAPCGGCACTRPERAARSCSATTSRTPW
uniref:Peroxidase n=1 Tax=Zea mays TaxID=4577 RepID=A0A804MIQ2_MAIZE